MAHKTHFRVKRLRWTDNPVNHQALGAFGFIYYVGKLLDNEGYDAGRLGIFNTLEAAKSAVQDHYDTKIMSEIDGLDDVLDALVGLVDCHSKFTGEPGHDAAVWAEADDKARAAISKATA